MSKVPARKKAQVIVAMLVVTAILIELGVTFGASSSYTFKKGIAEYPDDPRGYFDVIRNENGVEVYGIQNVNTAVGIGGRLPDDGESEGPFQILGLGDSQAQGQGVRYEDTMYAKLNAMLQQSGQAMQVRNVAVNGYNLDEIASRYAYEAKDPGTYEWVIYAMVLDDFGLERGKKKKNQPQPLLNDSDSPWRKRSAAYNFLAHIYDQWKLSEKTTKDVLESFQGDNFIEQSAKMKRLADAVDKDGGQFVVVILPLLYNFQNYPFLEVHSSISAWGVENEVAVIDGYQVLKHLTARDLWVHPTDHHPNEIAHEAIAQALFDKISSTTK